MDITRNSMIWENMASHYRRLYSAKPRVDSNLQKNKKKVLRTSSEGSSSHKIREKTYNIKAKKPAESKSEDSQEEQQAKRDRNQREKHNLVSRSVQTRRFQRYRPVDRKSVRFLRDITEDALKNGAFSDAALNTIFQKHEQRNKYNLDESLIERELDKLRKELNMAPIYQSLQNLYFPEVIDDRKSPTDVEALEALDSLVMSPEIRQHAISSLGINELVEQEIERKQIEEMYEKISQIKDEEVSFGSISPRPVSKQESGGDSESKREMSAKEKIEQSIAAIKEVNDSIHKSLSLNQLETVETRSSLDNSTQNYKTMSSILKEAKQSESNKKSESSKNSESSKKSELSGQSESSIKSDVEIMKSYENSTLKSEEKLSEQADESTYERLGSSSKSAKVTFEKQDDKKEDSSVKSVEDTDSEEEKMTDDVSVENTSDNEEIKGDSEHEDVDKDSGDGDTDGEDEKRSHVSTSSELSSVHTEID